MTEIQTLPLTTPTDDWNAQFETLKTRFPKVKPTILFAFSVLESEPDTSIDVLKVMAKAHDIRVTAATVSAARRLLSRNPATDGDATSPAPKAAAAKPRRTRQRRGVQAPLDVEEIIRNAVTKVQSQGDAEAERLRDAMRKVVAVLQEAVG